MFRIKKNHDGFVQKYKARLVAKSYHQVQGFNFQETFSPAVKPITARVILTLKIFRQQYVSQLDVNNVLLNGLLEEEVYTQQPPGFVDVNTSLVCKLNKAIYGSSRHLGPGLRSLVPPFTTLVFKPVNVIPHFLHSLSLPTSSLHSKWGLITCNILRTTGLL